MKKKAQINTLDFLIAVFIFSLVLIYAITSLNESAKNAISETDYKYMMITAIGISETLVKNNGIPSAWDKSNVELVGLASADRKISEQKVNEFCNMTQDEIRIIFRIPYYIHFSVNGTKTVACGISPNGKKTVSIRRNVFYENKSAVLEVALWR